MADTTESVVHAERNPDSDWALAGIAFGHNGSDHSLKDHARLMHSLAELRRTGNRRSPAVLGVGWNDK